MRCNLCDEDHEEVKDCLYRCGQCGGEYDREGDCPKYCTQEFEVPDDIMEGEYAEFPMLRGVDEKVVRLTINAATRLSNEGGVEEFYEPGNEKELVLTILDRGYLMAIMIGMFEEYDDELSRIGRDDEAVTLWMDWVYSIGWKMAAAAMAEINEAYAEVAEKVGPLKTPLPTCDVCGHGFFKMIVDKHGTRCPDCYLEPGVVRQATTGEK